jgi:CelD/BcsL family acetyltransferase involved in cellulose biosynthesis
MKRSNYRIKVFDDFQNAELKTAWIRLENETDAFPQMYYEWIEPWWRYMAGKRKLHIITVVDLNEEIVGIAPFCIENKCGLKILQSIPIHFGDFFFVLSVPFLFNYTLRSVINYTLSFKGWCIVHFFNVNDLSNLYSKLTHCSKYKKKKIVEILEPKFKDLTFNDFLLSLSKNTRGQYHKKINRLNRDGKLKLEVVTEADGYLDNFGHTRDIDTARRTYDYRPLLNDKYFKMRNEALLFCFNKGNVVLYNLRFNDEVIAFRLGFLHKLTFYDWKVSHNPEYDYYSPGFLLIGLVIEDLIQKGYESFNFMTGNYRFKRSWTNTNNTSSNYEFLAAKGYSLGTFYVYYRLRLRDKIRFMYHKIRTNILKK